MMSSPFFTVTIPPAASTPDHSVIVSVLITQVVTLLIFGLTHLLAHRSDRDKRARVDNLTPVGRKSGTAWPP